MPRPTKNQWDFGDLFANPPKGQAIPPAQTRPSTPTSTAIAAPVPAATPTEIEPRPPLSVTELTLGIKRQLEGAFGSVRVTGEVSNFRLQASGHAYFVLKDANAQLSCVLFRGQSGGDRARLKDGVKVTLGGEITVYEPRGQYQLRVTAVELEGMGALQAAFEKLKARLQAEGLFESSRKRPIPVFPRQIGLVTSPTGAALRDVLHVVERRYAGLEIILVPVRVQGEGAGELIAGAIASLNEWAGANPGAVDVILITRGGGSLEDLWAFNEEVVARAIADSKVPVVSAVGHEIDFTIADFVADLRAATPSAAAEILTAGYVQAAGRLAESARRLHWIFGRTFGDLRNQIEALLSRLTRLHPRRQLETRAQRLDELALALGRGSRRRLREAQIKMDSTIRRLADRRPRVLLELSRRELGEVRRRLGQVAQRQWEQCNRRLERAQRALELLSPLSILERGYSLTFVAATGLLLRNSAQAATGERLRTRLATGEVESRVEAITGSEETGSTGSPPSGIPRQAG